MNKICTSIEQSKKLIELGIDVNTADMCWQNNEFPIGFNDDNAVPAWSLAALLGVIPNVSLNAFKDGNWNAAIEQQNGKMIYVDKDNPVDACVELIFKLNEMKLL